MKLSTGLLCVTVETSCIRIEKSWT